MCVWECVGVVTKVTLQLFFKWKIRPGLRIYSHGVLTCKPFTSMCMCCTGMYIVPARTHEPTGLQFYTIESSSSWCNNTIWNSDKAALQHIHVNSNKQCNVSIIVRIHYCIRLRCIGNVVDCIEVVRAHNTISLSNRIYDRNLFLIT